MKYKRIIGFFLFCFYLFFSVCFFSFSSGEVVSYSFMDSGDEISSFKELLTRIGYLDEDDNTSNVYDRFTKIAVENLQKDFNLEVTGIATPEIRVICELLEKILMRKATDTTQKNETVEVSLPNVIGLSREEGKDLLKRNGFSVIEVDEYSDIKTENTIIKCTRGQNYDNMRATIYVSKGKQFITAKDCTWYAWWVKGSKKDTYIMYTPSIDREKQYLYIELDATLNSTNPLKWRGYGTAAITDTFDKCVPMKVEYEKEIITKGETQRIILGIPLKDLNIERPTTISVNIELFMGKDYSVEEHLRMDFTIAW